MKDELLKGYRLIGGEIQMHMCMPKIIRESSVTQARKGATSFRTTIPREIAEQLEVTHKDKIIWEVEPTGEEIKAIVYRKARE